MKVLSVECRNIRNHVHSLLECGEGLNVIVGKNGEGKTSLLEALSLAMLTRSFVVPNDRVVVRAGQDAMSVRADVQNDLEVRSLVEFFYTHGEGKKIIVNGEQSPTLVSHIGNYPTVTLTPDNKIITDGAPAERRTFLDLVLSQSSRIYLEDLVEYRRVVKQRNAILLDARMERRGYGAIEATIFPWTERMIALGAKIVAKRLKFLVEFKKFISEAFEKLAPENENFSIHYKFRLRDETYGETLEEIFSEEKIVADLRKKLEELRSEELRRGATLVGPHHDDLEFTINGMLVRSHASQGQHKTMLIALKLAECFFLREVTREYPIVLFDDILSELDSDRREKLFSVLADFGQAFLTTTDEHHFKNIFRAGGKRDQVFVVEKGSARKN